MALRLGTARERGMERNKEIYYKCGLIGCRGCVEKGEREKERERERETERERERERERCVL